MGCGRRKNDDWAENEGLNKGKTSRFQEIFAACLSNLFWKMIVSVIIAACRYRYRSMLAEVVTNAGKSIAAKDVQSQQRF